MLVDYSENYHGFRPEKPSNAQWLAVHLWITDTTVLLPLMPFV